MAPSLRHLRFARHLLIAGAVTLLSGAVLAPRRKPPPLLARGQGQLQMTVSAVRHVVSTADSVEIEYSVRNSGEPIQFTNLPEAFRFEVIDPTGREVPPKWISDYEPPVLGTLVKVILPRGGFVGQRITLSCIVNGYYERLPSPTWCGWGYEFSTPGEYRVIVRYSEPREGGLVMESDTARFTYRPRT